VIGSENGGPTIRIIGVPLSPRAHPSAVNESRSASQRGISSQVNLLRVTTNKDSLIKNDGKPSPVREKRKEI